MMHACMRQHLCFAFSSLITHHHIMLIAVFSTLHHQLGIGPYEEKETLALGAYVIFTISEGECELCDRATSYIYV